MSDPQPRFHTTNVHAGQTCAELVEILRKHGARSATVMYGSDQEPTGIAFMVPVPGLDDPVPISMTVQTEGIQRRLRGRYAGRSQARRTAWRQLKGLVELQLEIVANGVKEFHEVFAGDVLTEDGRTVGQRMGELMAPAEHGGVRLLTGGNDG